MNSKKKTVYIVAVLVILLIASFTAFFLIRNNAGDFGVAGVAEKDCVPYNIFIMRGQDDFSVDIKWSTRAECVGFVLYGRDRGNLDMVAVDLVNRSRSVEHIVTLNQLLTTEVYYFLINSQEQLYGNDGVPLEFVLDNL